MCLAWSTVVLLIETLKGSVLKGQERARVTFNTDRRCIYAIALVRRLGTSEEEDNNDNEERMGAAFCV